MLFYGFLRFFDWSWLCRLLSQAPAGMQQAHTLRPQLQALPNTYPPPS